MPQLDISTYSSQIFWLFFSFLTLYLVFRIKIIPLFEDLFQKRWDNIEGTENIANRFIEEGEEINKGCKKILEDARVKSNEILSKAEQESKSYFFNGKADFLNSVQERLRETKSSLRKEELEVEKNILDSISYLTIEIVLKSSNNILPKGKVESYLKENISSIENILHSRNKNE
jgi:F-type H+-transporting ATPase subunit b